MRTATLKLPVTYEQILDLVRQLPAREKIRLGEELAKAGLDAQFVQLLKSFKTSEISEDLINQEVEIVRAELYEKKKKK